jgi:hypothetical protein
VKLNLGNKYPKLITHENKSLLKRTQKSVLKTY